MNSETHAILPLIEDMAKRGCGLLWSESHQEYRPFTADDDVIEFWHDPIPGASKDFHTAVRDTHAEMTREVNQEQQ